MDRTLVFLGESERDPFLELERRWRYPSRGSAEHIRYQRELMSSAWGRRSWRIAALRGASGELGAALSLHDLSYRLGSRRLRLAGISSLAVAPRYRGLGLGRVLLEGLHAWLREHDYDGALAFSIIGGRYFALLGYEPLPLAALEADLEGWRSHGPPVDSPSALRPYEPRDFDAVRNLYNTTSSLQRLAVLRDEAYWEFVLRRFALADRMFPAERHVFLVGERDERVVSYMWAGVRGSGRRLVVFEYGVEPGAAEDLTALSRAVLERLGAEPPRRLRCVVPTRFRNWCPARHTAWRAEKRNVLMMLPLSGFAVPSESGQDERLIWTADRF